CVNVLRPLTERFWDSSATLFPMTYYGAKELAEAYRTVRKNTLIIANEIPEDKYSFQATPETRTVAETLTHIALSPRMAYHLHKELQLTDLTGFDSPTFFAGLMAEAGKPRTKDEIIALLSEEGEKVAGWMETLSEDFLGTRVTFPAGMEPPS